MLARRLMALTSVTLCASVCALIAAVNSAAAATSFGTLGPEAGQVFNPRGVAVDQASGDIYVGDELNNRIDKFDGSGAFLMAWGWGVADGASEPQTCAATCQAGHEGGGAGELGLPEGVAVDNDLSSLSYGDVYVVDFANYRVEKFNASGEFLLAFGGHVNATTSGDVCLAGEACQAGTPGAGNGEFEWEYGRSYIAVGPGGAVYVGDKARVQAFEPSGAWKESVSLSGISSTGRVTGLAIGAAGDIYVADSEAAGVRVLEPNGTEKMTLDGGSSSIEAIALDGAGDLFVGDGSGGFHVLEYDSAGNEIESFAKSTAAATSGMAFGDSRGYLYASDPASQTMWALGTPPPGPLIEPDSVSANGGERGVASLEAVVNPEGAETTYKFEYVDEAHFQESGYASAASTPPASLGSSFEDQVASASLTALTPGETYHYRLVATNSNGTVTSADLQFATVPPALIDGPWASDVAGTSVTLSAQINPLGASTDYQLEYGPTTSYGQTLSGNVGEGRSSVLISYHRQELQPSTVYHFRIVTHNEVGTIEGADHTFKTQAAGGVLTLADGRAWELVSPANKRGASIEPWDRGATQAAIGGDAISYMSSEPIGEHPQGKSGRSQNLSVRGSGGWRTEGIAIPYPIPKEEPVVNLFNGNPEYQVFSPDLSAAVVEPHDLLKFSLSPQAPERTIYLRDDTNGTYQPLVNDNNVPPGTKYGGVLEGNSGAVMEFLGTTPDLNHVVISSNAALTPEADSEAMCGGREFCHPRNLFEWSDGKLKLVNILPDGEPTFTAYLGLASVTTAHAISSDGQRIVWQVSPQYPFSLYVRDMVEQKTVRVGHNRALFQAMSADGSKVFYIENEELYVCEPRMNASTDALECIVSDLTESHGTSHTAGAQHALIGMSEDGAYVYFIATGVLADGGVAGADNLYLAQESGGKWSAPRYIASLSVEDEKDWFSTENTTTEQVELSKVTSRVSSSGRYLAFMSNSSLTGYDNVDANSPSGESRHDEEVYLYDAVADRLVCASCNPTGARPVGVFDQAGRTPPLLVDLRETWTFRHSSGDHWLAANVPGWREAYNYRAVYQPRYLSDSGRLFFNSSDALAPQDTNGQEDVYEYEPSGVGGCGPAVATFTGQAAGCIGLISSGTSAAESAFVDASGHGDDAFFVSQSRLTAGDYDTAYDMYDAHVCSASVPCAAEPVAPPPCTTSDSCKPAVTPQPEIFGPAPSATFNGVGNVTPTGKRHTRARVHKRALRCKKIKKRKRRLACERKARRRLHARRSRAAVTSKKGGDR